MDNHYMEELPAAVSFLHLLDASTEETSHSEQTTTPGGQKLWKKHKSTSFSNANRFMSYGAGYDDSCKWSQKCPYSNGCSRLSNGNIGEIAIW